MKTKPNYLRIKTSLDYFQPPKRDLIIGRDQEASKLQLVRAENTPAILIMYGRRRVGKTSLIEETYRGKRLLKFEGDEALDDIGQIKNCLEQLSRYAKDPKIAKLDYSSWREFFLLLWDYISEGEWVVYLEELQWLARYKANLISELKYIWDNYYQGNKKLLVILCGSSHSFMINHVLHSKALYNRSQHEIYLKPLTIQSSIKLLKFKTLKQSIDAFLMVGGIPEYLKYMNGEKTAIRAMSIHSFTDSGYFLNEYKRIFISSLAKNKDYKRILEFISVNYSVTAEQIYKGLKMKRNGTFKRILQDLELCGFIIKVTPFDAKINTTLIKYEIADNYLHFYYAFIKPIENKIRRGDYINNLFDVVKPLRLSQWLGYAFERFLRQNPNIIAKILQFAAVEYESGTYFNRVEKDNKFQIDLAYMRKDRVLTICEVKYTETPVGISVIQELENKIERLSTEIKKRYEIQRVLISREGATKELVERGYFDRILSVEEVVKS